MAFQRRENITLTQLRALSVALATGSIGEASRRLGLTQPALSQSIISLERLLGIALLSRGRDGVQPTTAATEITTHLDVIFSAVAQIEALTAQPVHSRPGVMRVAAVPSAMRSIVPRCVKRFRSLHPELRLRFFEGGHAQVQNWTANGIADIGFAADTTGDGAGVEILREELIAVAKFGHAIMRKTTIAPQDLAKEIFIVPGSGCEAVMTAAFSQDHMPERIIACDRIRTALDMVREGIGLTVLPESMIASLDLLDLRTRRFSPMQVRKLCAIINHTSPMADLAIVFQGIAREIGATVTIENLPLSNTE